MPTIQKIFIQVFLALILVGIITPALSKTPSKINEPSPLTIYFYNPEINTARNVVLKHTFDLYLKGQGLYQFQPVDSRATFEDLIKHEDNAIFMMSSWHFLQLKQERSSSKSIPVLGLRGLKKGNDTYRKILVGKEASLNIESMSIATSGTIKYSLNILRNMFPSRSLDIFSKLNILRVPKDIDALMAVGFGLADAALTTKLSLKTLSTLYKNQYQQLHTLAESQEIKRLVVVFRQTSVHEYYRAANIIEKMKDSKKGRRGLNMLGLDSWQLVDKQLIENRETKQ